MKCANETPIAFDALMGSEQMEALGRIEALLSQIAATLRAVTEGISVSNPALAKVVAGRDHLTTKEFAMAINKTEQHIRKNHHLNGHAFGIRPIKVGRRLLWPVSDVAAALTKTQAPAERTAP